eukprot:scaffold94209_cov22-Tisochrysis_lutea.AAC.1
MSQISYDAPRTGAVCTPSGLHGLLRFECCFKKAVLLSRHWEVPLALCLCEAAVAASQKVAVAHHKKYVAEAYWPSLSAWSSYIPCTTAVCRA